MVGLLVVIFVGLGLSMEGFQWWRLVVFFLTDFVVVWVQWVLVVAGLIGFGGSF